jgi:mannose-1-phosphate guanylyltransferase
MSGANVWALILAAGEGSRLRGLTTTPGGLYVPKQFCSLQGGPSLLEETLRRAESVALRRRTVTVVAAQHRRWWAAPLCSRDPENLIVQPENKGTAPGLLLPLLHIMRRDPNATVVVLPSDHFVRSESVLARGLQQAARLARIDQQHVYLLGLVPDEIDPELGYILPGDGTGGDSCPVRQFIEKPAIDIARDLVRNGALWNVFILAASARALLGLYSSRFSALVSDMSRAVEQDGKDSRIAKAARALYPELPTLDFSRDVVQGQESRLRVLTVPACGWSDLGTPRRVADTLTRIGRKANPAHEPGPTGHLNLAAQHSRQQYAT